MLQNHLYQHGIYEKIIDLMPMLFKFVKPFNTREFATLKDVGIFVRSFLQVAKDRKCGTNFVVKIIRFLRNVARVWLKT